MKKKIIGLCILLLVLLLGFSINSYAVFDMNIITDHLSKLKQKGLINDVPQTSNSSWNSLVNNSNNSNLFGYGILITSSNSSEQPNRLIIIDWNSTVNGSGVINNYTNSSNNALYNNWSIYNGFSFSLNGTGGYEGSFKFNLMQFKYAYCTININTRSLVLSANTEYGATVLGNNLDFTQAGQIDNLTVGTYSDVKGLKVRFSTTSEVLGTIHNLSDFETPIRYSFSNVSDDVNASLRQLELRHEDYTTDRFYIPSRLLYNYNLYVLRIWLDDEEYEYYYYILPYDSSVVDGQVIPFNDLSGDNVNYDYNLQNSTNDIIENQNALPDTETILNDSLGSTSGELLDKFGYHVYDVQWNNFIYSMFMDIQRVLLSSEDVIFTFPYMNTNITVRSSQFTTPNGPIKTFISAFLVFGFLVLIYQEIAKFYHRIETLNISSALNIHEVNDESIIM